MCFSSKMGVDATKAEEEDQGGAADGELEVNHDLPAIQADDHALEQEIDAVHAENRVLAADEQGAWDNAEDAETRAATALDALAAASAETAKRLASATAAVSSTADDAESVAQAAADAAAKTELEQRSDAVSALARDLVGSAADLVVQNTVQGSAAATTLQASVRGNAARSERARLDRASSTVGSAAHGRGD